MHRPTLFAILLLATSGVSAQAYKWTDAQGTVHYSESAPPAGTKYTRITTTGSVDPIAATPTPPPAGQDGENAAQPASQPMEDTPENRSKLCSSLKANLDTLRSGAPVVMEQAGKPKTLDDNERQQQIASAQSQYGEFCK
ncbi:DUF4124 domain-containing protein [Dyella sp.]|jgi:hypothetical protein|uniref:DUF4124 domain-containing protein n=1 Tax=Dyella sp. TaxID=1869338 RepID=UPI002D78E47F|nr:DUF4124 domain-containing protein [Dyella sp.]HET6430928.1 DUF4124 domain-containing protein [Dyella sp.]